MNERCSKRKREAPLAMATAPMHSRKLMQPPMIRLQKCTCEEAFSSQKQRNSRQPQLAIGIRVAIRCCTHDVTDEYYGEYLQHSLHRTTFLLKSVQADDHQTKFHNKFFKLAKQKDIEPGVFERARNLDFTTCILLQAEAMDEDSGIVFHCWITEQCMPLSEVMSVSKLFNCFNKWELHIDKSKCCQAAYCCLLRAAQSCFYMTDCALQNFGVRIGHDAVHHIVVIIDVGSTDFERYEWSKSDVDTHVMQKFWVHCEAAGIDITDLKNAWQAHPKLETALHETQEQWQSAGTLTSPKVSTNTIAISMSLREEKRRHSVRQSNTYKLVSALGRAIGGKQWNNNCALQCYRASEAMHFKPSAPVTKEIQQLAVMIDRPGDDTSLDERFRFWMELDAYREIQCDRIGHDARQPLTKAEAEKILISYRKFVLWHELSPQQKKSLNWRSILGAILHKRAGWKPAALSILQYGLPSVQQLRAVHDVQEHIQSLAELASAIVCWINIFACDMAEVHQSSEYVLQRTHSDNALRDRCDRRSNRWQQESDTIATER